jgi:hypothetical protein
VRRVAQLVAKHRHLERPAAGVDRPLPTRSTSARSARGSGSGRRSRRP